MQELMNVSVLNVIRVDDNSDEHTSRLCLTFNNGYMLSIVRGRFSYGGKSGLFEIAPMKVNGEWAPELLDEADQGDDVVGWCSVARVSYYINKVSLYNDRGVEECTPEQIPQL